MKKRPYGKSGIELSVIGFGGILVRDETTEEAARLVSQAVDWGINYFDVAPSYGNAQEMLGPALEPYRNEVFLACKTGERLGAEADRELKESLELLRTDHLDLYQFHAVTTDDDVDQILGPKGALETVVAAKEAGIVNHVGFSAHTENAALRLLDAYPFDSVLFPVNWVTWNTGNFGPAVMERAVERGVAVLALKTLAKRRYLSNAEKDKTPKAWYFPVENYEEALLAVKFTLSKQVTAAVSPGHEYLLKWAVDAQEEFVPITAEEEALLAGRAKELEPVFSA